MLKKLVKKKPPNISEGFFGSYMELLNVTLPLQNPRR